MRALVHRRRTFKSFSVDLPVHIIAGVDQLLYVSPALELNGFTIVSASATVQILEDSNPGTGFELVGHLVVGEVSAVSVLALVNPGLQFGGVVGPGSYVTTNQSRNDALQGSARWALRVVNEQGNPRDLRLKIVGSIVAGAKR